jgi:predicted MPP superfamily phosphohydrolase
LIRYIENIHIKLLFSVLSLLLLAIVAYTPPFLQKALAVSDTHIVAAGDWGCSSNTEKTVNNAKSMNPQLLLALGDYSYEKTSTCWIDLIKPVDSITKINFGNHEGSDSLINSYLNHFGLSKQYYSFDIKNVHVLTMATEEKFDTNSEQYNFVVNDLRKAANNPDIKWIIVTMHYPFYSSPNTCKESDCAGNEESRDLFHPLFDKYGVDLVLQGHVHNYQRSFPLKFNQESSSKPLVASNSKADYENPNGVIFAIVGTGGVNLHGLSDSAPFMAYQQDSKFGILDMHISDNKLDAKFVTNDGATLDHFSISKTVKKKIIERISDNIVTDTKAKPLSDKQDTKAKPLSDKQDTKAKPLIVKDENNKPVISYKLNDNTATDIKAKPVQEEVQKDKPTITYKLNDNIVTDTNAKPLSEEKGKDKPTITYKLNDNTATDTKAKPVQEEVQKDKPTITYKLNDNTATDTNAKPLSDKQDTKAKPVQEEVQKDKPAITYKLNDNTATDTNAKPLSDKQDTKAKPVQEEVQKDKPAITKELSNDGLTDEKPKSLHNEDKADLSNEDKSTNDKSDVGGLLGPSDNTDPVDNENIDHNGEKTTITNERDPFAGLK